MEGRTTVNSVPFWSSTTVGHYRCDWLVSKMLAAKEPKYVPRRVQVLGVATMRRW
jgi:hypothetical protein